MTELLYAETGLYHLRERQYQPGTGRFLQTDVLSAIASDPHVPPYVYVRNRPTVLIDHSGACPSCVLAAAGAAAGAAVSGIAYTVTSGDDFSWCGVGGAGAAALQDYISTGQVSPTNVVPGGGFNAIGEYIGNWLFPTHGMSTPAQLRYFAPRTLRGMFSGRHNIRAIYS